MKTFYKVMMHDRTHGILDVHMMDASGNAIRNEFNNEIDAENAIKTIGRISFSIKTNLSNQSITKTREEIKYSNLTFFVKKIMKLEFDD